MPSPLLEIRDLCVAADTKPILDHVNLTVQSGELHVLMGRNGSGKSTLVSAIMGSPEYKVTHGQILFRGEDLVPLSVDRRARMGIFLSFQSPQEIPGVSLEDFVRTARQAVAQDQMRVTKFHREFIARMKSLNMDPSYAERYVNVGFSGGEKKKAEILQMLMLNPSLALLDETDSGLDVDAVRTVASAIQSWHTAENSLIIITHNARLLESLPVDRVHVLDGSRISRSGGPELIQEITSSGFGSKEDAVND